MIEFTLILMLFFGFNLENDDTLKVKNGFVDNRKIAYEQKSLHNKIQNTSAKLDSIIAILKEKKIKK